MAEPRVIQVAKVPTRKLDSSWEEIAALICWYYPAYTFNQARKLPHKRSMLLLKTARLMEATRYYNLTQIAAAPHTKKGEGVKKLTKQYEGLMNA